MKNVEYNCRDENKLCFKVMLNLVNKIHNFFVFENISALS